MRSEAEWGVEGGRAAVTAAAVVLAPEGGCGEVWPLKGVWPSL